MGYALNKRGSDGFSMIEMIIAMAVLAIMAAIATPSFINVIRRSELKQGAQSISNTLYEARIEAVKTGVACNIVFSSINESFSGSGCTIATNELPERARIGTSSLRRRAQVLAARPDLEIVDLRGNLDTRLKKLDSGDFDAIIAARAGLIRLGMADKASEIIPYDVMLPAVGQGALCIEVRENDQKVKNLIRILIDYNSMFEVKAERALLARLQGGCQVPIGAHAEVIYPSNLKIEAVVCSLDGTTVIRDTVEGKVDDFSTMGIELASKLLGRGGLKILEDIRADLGQE